GLWSPNSARGSGPTTASLDAQTLRGARVRRALQGLCSGAARLAATHRITAIEALVAGAVTHGDVSATIAHWRIAHHVFEVSTQGAQAALGSRGCAELQRVLRGRGWQGAGGLECEAVGRRIVDHWLVFRLGFDLSKVVTLQVLDAEDAEQVVDDRRRELDV